MGEDNNDTGAPGWWIELRKNRTFWYMSFVFGIVVAIVGGIFAFTEFGDNLQGAGEAARESGLLRARCVFDPAAEGEALIIILPFHVTASGSSDAHNLIHEAIEEKIKELGLENVRAEIDPNVILHLSEREKAKEIGESCNAAVVIWGTETRTSVKVNFLKIKNPCCTPSNERVRILAPESLVGTEFIESHLPGQLAFLALFAVGEAIVAEGEFTKAIPIIEEAIASMSEELIAENLDSSASASAAYLQLGWLYTVPPTQDYRKAKEAYEKSLVFDSSNRFALGNLGTIYESLGGYETALDNYELALAIAREIGDRYGESIFLGGLGNVYERLGRYEMALDYQDDALAIAREIGDRYGESSFLSGLGNVYRSLGQYETALDYYEHALAIAQEIGDRQGEEAHLGNLGNVHLSLGQYETALDYYEQALFISHEIGDRKGEGIWLGGLGYVYESLGQYETAIDKFELALGIAREIGDRKGEGIWLSGLGHVYESLRQYETALDYHVRALDIAHEIGDRSGEGHRLGNIGIVYLSLGEYEMATNYLEQGISILEEVKSPEAERYQQVLDDIEQESGGG